MIRASAFGNTGAATPLAAGETISGDSAGEPAPIRLQADRTGLSPKAQRALFACNAAKYGSLDGPVMYAADMYQLAHAADRDTIVGYLNGNATAATLQRIV